jgi:hypothetical protein
LEDPPELTQIGISGLKMCHLATQIPVPVPDPCRKYINKNTLTLFSVGSACAKMISPPFVLTGPFSTSMDSTLAQKNFKYFLGPMNLFLSKLKQTMNVKSISGCVT